LALVVLALLGQAITVPIQFLALSPQLEVARVAVMTPKTVRLVAAAVAAQVGPQLRQIPVGLELQRKALTAAQVAAAQQSPT
jgi:hypothetical protein